VAVPMRVAEPLHQQQADAFGEGHAVGGVGERLAPAVLRQRPLPTERDERVRGGHHRRATGQGQGALATAQ
jgi:hypothetical protein